MTPAITYLFVPGDRPERFAKAMASGADRIVLDLEDAVQPDQKASARCSILAADLDWRRVVVRVNDAASSFFADDLNFLSLCKAAAVLLPKAETPDMLLKVRAASGRMVELLPLVETVRGLANLPSLLGTENVSRAVFGHLDFALDLGCSTDWSSLLFVRAQIVFQSRLANVLPPIDGITTDVRNADAARADAQAARQLGFGGKLLVHPAQVVPVAAAFAPTLEEVTWAKRVLAAIDGQAGAVALDGKMIDKPVKEAALRILARAKV